MFSKNLIILALYVLTAFSAPSPLVKVQKAKEPIAGRYIVTLKEGINLRANIDALSRKLNGSSSITQELNIINGFAGSFSPTELEALSSDPGVAFIEEDGLVRTQTVITQ